MRAHFSQLETLFKSLPVLLIAFGTIGCATVQNQPPQTIANTNTSSTQIYSQHIRGTLLDVDGKSPVAGATVYVAKNTAQLKQHSMLNDLSLSSSTPLVNKQPCAAPSVSYAAYACTHADGTFDLAINQVTQIPLPIIFTKGQNKISISLDLNDLGANIGEVAFNLPKKLQQKIAIVLDFFNPYEGIKHQLKTGQYNVREAFKDISRQMVEMFNLENTKSKVLFPTFESLFEDWDGDHQIDLYKYDVIYINSQNSRDISSLSKEKREALLEYLSKGGQLYITEWKFQLPEIPPDLYI